MTQVTLGTSHPIRKSAPAAARPNPTGRTVPKTFTGDRYVAASRRGPAAARPDLTEIQPYVERSDPSFRVYGATGATWLTGAATDSLTVQRVVAAAKVQGTLPVLVQYALPDRDAQGPNRGGISDPEAYMDSVKANARALGRATAIVVIEPNALPQHLNEQTVKQVLETYREADPNAALYLDAGHSNWKSPATMANSLLRAGIREAQGFTVNVSAYEYTADAEAFGEQVVRALVAQDPSLSNVQFIVDTSRNGNGPGVDEKGRATWGDPVRAANGGAIAVGPGATSRTDTPHAAAFMWIKPPGYGDNRTRPASTFGGEAWVRPAK